VYGEEEVKLHATLTLKLSTVESLASILDSFARGKGPFSSVGETVWTLELVCRPKLCHSRKWNPDSSVVYLIT
jgi:hypothetical protein